MVFVGACQVPATMGHASIIDATTCKNSHSTIERKIVKAKIASDDLLELAELADLLSASCQGNNFKRADELTKRIHARLQEPEQN